MLDWIDLPETVTVRRASRTTTTPRGKILATGHTETPLRCLIQPHRGSLKYEVEGVVQDVTEALSCNLVSQSGAATDIQYLDTIIRANGTHRHAAFVADEGGQGDHLKVYLVSAGGAVTTG